MGDDILSPSECKKLQNNLQTVTTRGRQPGLLLATLEGEIDIMDAGTELINDLTLTATLLDQLHNTDQYSFSVNAQVKKIQDSTLTPSAMCLDSITKYGLEYDEWVLEKSKEHKKSFDQQMVNDSIFNQFEQEVEQSIIKQKQTEDGDTIGFDEFLKHHRTGTL